MNSNQPALLGLAHIMRMAFGGQSLHPLFDTLMARAARDPLDANALMDLSTVLQLNGIHDVGLATLSMALQVQRVYVLPAKRQPNIRLLAIMGPGDLMANAPLPFLVEDSDIALTMLYVLPGEPMATPLPEHDIAFVAISESSHTRGLLEQLVPEIAAWPTPVIVRPECILRASRDTASALLQHAGGVYVPPTAQTTRLALEALCVDHQRVADLMPGGAFPLIIRPRNSHAGHGLEKVNGTASLALYLAASTETDFFISSFVDYSGSDSLYRKYRVVLIDGTPFAVHMGISTHWMIHYLNAGMVESATKRAQEEAFMRHFDHDFAQRHRAALVHIHQRFDLEYLVIDCAETSDGDLLVFEVDTGAVVHAMDPSNLFPYKQAAMQKVFDAFRAMLVRKTDPGTKESAL